MINREDMLELTRRMTLSRTSFTGTAGYYIDRNRGFDGSFSVNFLRLSASERTKKLKLAKRIPFAATSVDPEKYGYPQDTREPGSMWQLLMAMSECGLKNDTLIDTFHDVIMKHYRAEREYATLIFHDRYDIPARGSDRKRQWGSEGVFEYTICAVCPLNGGYEPDKPVCGFSFLAFADRSGDLGHVDVFQAGAGKPHNEILKPLEII